MASRQCRCGYKTEDIWVDECPLCLKPMALTGCAVPNQPAAEATGRRRKPLYTTLVIMGLIVLPIAIGLMAVSTGVAAPLFLDKPSSTDSTGRIRAGIPLREAVQELEPAPDPEAEVTLQHLFLPGAKSSGRFTWSNGTPDLRVTFRDWRVWSVEEGSMPFPVGSLVRIDYDVQQRPRHAAR